MKTLPIHPVEAGDMKHFMDYKPTREEIEAIFGDPDDQETLEYIKFIEGTDSEKFEIAGLLMSRGENKEAFEMIDAIEDEMYRDDMRQIIKSWLSLPPGQSNEGP